MGARENGEGRDEKKGVGPDYVHARDSLSSQSESPGNEDSKVKKSFRGSKEAQ